MYEKRYVAFVDILGFSKKVEESINNEKIEKSISNCLSFLEWTRKTTMESFGRNPDSEPFQESLFSDSIILSCPEHDKGGLFHILYSLSLLICSLAEEGFFVRGGVTYGDLVHRNRTCYGPALLRAYELEQIADSPRIIMDRGVVERYVNDSKARVNNQEYEERFLRRFLCADYDYEYLDLFSNCGELYDDPINQFDWLQKVRSFIINGLSESSEKIKHKYMWLRQKLNEFIEKQIIETYPICSDKEKRYSYESWANMKID